MKLLTEDDFAAALNTTWGERQATSLRVEEWNLSLPMLYAVYRDYRGRALARLRDAVPDERERRFADYRDRVQEIGEAADTLRRAAECLNWVGGLFMPTEIPDILGTTGPQPIPLIEPTSIPHTLRPVMWVSPFGPSKSPHPSFDETDDPATWRPAWMSDFEDTVFFLSNVAGILDWCGPMIARTTIAQQDNADRRGFRKLFAKLVSRANPSKRRMALDALGAVLFSLTFGTSTDEATYRTQRRRDGKRQKQPAKPT